MIFGFYELVKYNDKIFSRGVSSIDEPILNFSLSDNNNLNILEIIVGKNNKKIGYVGVLDNKERVSDYISSKGTSSKFGKIQIIYINNENIKLIDEHYKVSMNDVVQDFENITEFTNVFNKLSEKESSYPSSALLKVVHTISEDKKNLETEIVVIFLNLSK